LCAAALGASVGITIAARCTQEELPEYRLNMAVIAALLGIMVGLALYALVRRLGDPARRKEFLVGAGALAILTALIFAVGTGVYYLGERGAPARAQRRAAQRAVEEKEQAQQARDQALAPIRDAYAHQLYGKTYAELDRDHKAAVEYMRAYNEAAPTASHR
jgi:small-conductance mechanosensitive channel